MADELDLIREIDERRIERLEDLITSSVRQDATHAERLQNLCTRLGELEESHKKLSERTSVLEFGKAKFLGAVAVIAAIAGYVGNWILSWWKPF